MNIISILNVSKFGPTENWSRFIEVEGNLYFDQFLAEAGEVQIVFL